MTFSKYKDSHSTIKTEDVFYFLAWYDKTHKNIFKQTKKNGKRCKYLNVPISFDIETTNTIVDNKEIAFCYIWQFDFDGYVFIGRSLDEYVSFCKVIEKYFNSIEDNIVLVVYVHNLSFEFQFLKNYFNFENVFAISTYKPIRAFSPECGFEYRCSYKLTNLSLNALSKKTETKKLVGDLDYNLIRHNDTHLTGKELQYCINDVEILVEYIEQLIIQYKSIIDIPLTSTGAVRKVVKRNVLQSKKYKWQIQSIKIDGKKEMQLLKRAFMGGFTHANVEHSNETIVNVSSYDFTSSYPAVMCYSNQFPMSSGVKVKVKNKKHFETLCKNNCLIFECEFININANFLFENYISEHKCSTLEKATINNGRVVGASKLCMCMTNIDFDIIKKCYSWEKMRIGVCYSYKRGYLPKEYILNILDWYNKKTQLKGVSGEEQYYNLLKTRINALYGMMVTGIDKPTIEYTNNKWIEKPVDLEEIVEKYNRDFGRFISYPCGVFVTAIARSNLWRGIFELKDDYIYSDTDSVKFKNIEQHKKFFDNDNKEIEKKLNKMCEHYKIDKSLIYPKNKKGVVCLLGVWDYEGTYKIFKTLGAKRYIYIDDKYNLHITVAGLSKQIGCKYLVDKFGKYGVFKHFVDGLYIDSEHTGKLTHKYYDNNDFLYFDIKDYYGNIKTCKIGSYVYLTGCEFDMSLTKDYLNLIIGIRQELKSI